MNQYKDFTVFTFSWIWFFLDNPCAINAFWIALKLGQEDASKDKTVRVRGDRQIGGPYASTSASAFSLVRPVLGFI